MHVLAQDREAIVFSYGRESIARFGCLRAGRRAYVLNINAGVGLDNVDSIELVGHFVVYNDNYDDATIVAGNYILADLQRGTGRSVSNNLDPMFAGYKVAANGAFVLLKTIGLTPTQGYEIYRDDRRGLALLDRSATIDPQSLRIRHNVIDWTDNGAPRRASLAGLDRRHAFRLATKAPV